MSDLSQNAPSISRRDFLKLGGATAGAALIPVPLMSAASFIIAGRVRTALLLPHFTLAPAASGRFSASFTAGADSRFGVQTLSIGRGLTTQVVAAAREALAGGAKIIAAYINDNDADELSALTEAAGAGLLIVNHGENMPRISLNHPRVARVSLNRWADQYALGRQAAAQYGRIVMLTSLYESGFDSPYAFRLGFESAGGAVVGQFVARDTQSLAAAVEATARLRPEAVYAAFSGTDVHLFQRTWTLAMPVLTPGLGDTSAQFDRLGGLAAAALNRWDGAKFQPDLVELPTDALQAAARHAETAKTGWLHPYMTL